jgi:multicomponent K+:H+ antiporter subunit A
VVNVILVDFRGFDTFGEIIVLGIAGVAIFAMLDGAAARPGAAAAAMGSGPSAGRGRHPLMLVVATRVMLPIALMVGVYIFLRGHNQPGGGFIAGLVVAIALIMQYMASGFAWAGPQRIDYHAMIGAGVLIAALTGIGSWLAGRPFLTSGLRLLHGCRRWAKFELATAMPSTSACS